MPSQPIELNAATEIFTRSINQARSRQLTIVDLFGAAAKLLTLEQRPLGVELYKTWIAYNSDSALLYAAYFNYGIALSEVRDHAGAINAFRECIRLKPDFHPPYINLGRVLEDTGQAGSAVTQWLALCNDLKTVNGESVSHKITALQQIARVLEAANNDNAAEDALKQSLDLDAHHPEAIQHWISLRQRQCKWPVVAEWERVSRKVLLEGMSALSAANFTDDPMFQLAKAYRYARHAIGTPKAVARPHEAASLSRRDPHRLRIGYVSSDLREHAVGFAMTDVTEQHDHENFEIFAYYCGIGRTDPTQQRIMNAVDHWTDINGLNDDQAAAKIAADGIDILVDLNGYTKDARTKVFARRPAPIAANWYGFPSSMGTPYHHYIIADPYLIPEDYEAYYSEKVLRLPCYQPNDRKRVVSSRRPTRAEAGLPETGFVYCSLNGMQKITSLVFQRWMMILGRVQDSVLWLLTGTTEANDRLRKAASDLGVSPERIVFAEKMANPDHLARYPLADLFLDSMPYGAHTTASDSLWMNVPILTLPGRSFASRVCADLVRAAGAGELICSTPEDYVTRAVEFGTNRDVLAAIKARLASGRDSSLLFDTPQLVRHLEDLYRQMWSEFRAGALPVPNLRNLDIYHEIGVGLDLENIELLTDDAYLKLYQGKVAEWDASYPIAPDGRLWRGAPPKSSAITSRRAVA
jgi:predicted O-linked N-acetylglucosamine transferase (SPINDLY family)